MELRGRRALVTGAGQRLGRAIAYGLLRRGVHLAIHYHRSEAGAKAGAMEAEVAGVRAALLQADLRDAAEAERLPARAAEALGGLDIVVSSAAVLERHPVAEVTPEDWDRTLSLNLRAGFFVAKGAAAVMGEAGGVIVAIADVAAFEAWRDYTVHCITKAGVVSMTAALAKAFAPRIRVNAVAPGPVLLPDDWDPAARQRLVSTTPLRRLGKPDDVAGAVIFLIENDYMTGATVVVDGGRLVR